MMHLCTGLTVFVLALRFVDEVKGNCLLTLNKSFGSPQPVILKRGEFLAPNTQDGAISISRGETLTIACPGEKKFIVFENTTTEYHYVTGECMVNTTFRVGQWVGSLNNIKCNAPPWFKTLSTNEKCGGNNKIIRVGYDINNKFFELYQVCFNYPILSAVYTKHELAPSSYFTQNGGARPQFIVGDVFGKTKMSEFYKTEHQKKRINELLGGDMQDKYITKNQYLTRGHLAPRADFPLYSTQRPSFHYANAAPQWRRGNAGDWAALEEALRRRVRALNRTVTVYTGTFGVTSLEDATGKLQEIHLAADENNNWIVPVPLYFFKVVHDTKAKTATAFVSINSSYYNKTMLKKLSFCEDSCADIGLPWLKWRSNDATHSFCCDFAAFRDKIDVLPSINVDGLFV